MHTVRQGQFIHGRFPDVFLDGTLTLQSLQLTLVHEGVHRQLEYSSSYGLFLTLLILLEEDFAAPLPASAELHKSTEELFRASVLVHEGCATFLTLNACMAAYGRVEADSLLSRLPADYRNASRFFQDCLLSVQSDRALGNLALKNLEYLMNGIALAALNGSICAEFADPSTFSLDGIRKYLDRDSPRLRLEKVQVFLKSGSNARDYVEFCAGRASDLFGPRIRLFDGDFMKEFIRSNPLEFELLQSRVNLEMRRSLVAWFREKQVIGIDPTFDALFSDVDQWSPFLLANRWDRQLGITCGLRDAWVEPGAIDEARQVVLAHAVNYSLDDRRKVVPTEGTGALTASIEPVHQCVARVTYVPLSDDMPTLRIVGLRRFLVDWALYDGLECRDKTIFVHGLSMSDLVSLLRRKSESACLMSVSNHEQLCRDWKELPDPGAWPSQLYVYFKPAEHDLLSHIRQTKNRFALRRIMPFAHRNKMLPGICEIEEDIGDRRVSFFCLADKVLMDSYPELIARLPNVEDQGVSTSGTSMRCAVEACYGIHSAIERITGQLKER